MSLLPGVVPAQDTAQLARTGQRALDDNAYTTAVYFLKQAAAADPRHPSAWKELCRAYLALGQVDAAIDACHSQIDVYPDSPEVYRTLGQALWRNGKREEAIGAFRRQIEIDAEDSAAYASLGQLYCELRKYAEAVPVLEKSLAIYPNYVIGQASLGDAYLGIGKIDQGLAILNKLAHDQSRSEPLNRVALILASHRVELDIAQQYAEAAVTAAGADLQRRAEQPVSLDTLRRVVLLADCWDTLGWIHFQRAIRTRRTSFSLRLTL